MNSLFSSTHDHLRIEMNVLMTYLRPLMVSVDIGSWITRTSLLNVSFEDKLNMRWTNWSKPSWLRHLKYSFSEIYASERYTFWCTPSPFC